MLYYALGLALGPRARLQPQVGGGGAAVVPDLLI